jgi:hypothetical protein
MGIKEELKAEKFKKTDDPEIEQSREDRSCAAVFGQEAPP